jgi:hypothetical protein
MREKEERVRKGEMRGKKDEEIEEGKEKRKKRGEKRNHLVIIK